MKYTEPSGHGTTSGSDRGDDNDGFYEDIYDSQYDTIPEYEDFLQDMQDAQNEGTNQSALYDLVDEMNQSGGLDAEDQSTIHDWADEYGVDYDSLGVNAADGGSVQPDVPNNVNFDKKQLGKKWGKHKTDYPDMKNYTEYQNYANEVFNNPDKIVYDAVNKEYLYIKGDDLLRVGENGEFVSLYPGAASGRVTNAIENGGTVWP